MPEIAKVIIVKISIEQFLDNCSDNELKEIGLLIQSPRYLNRIKGKEQIGFKQAKKENDQE